jgi:hypothetical protein
MACPAEDTFVFWDVEFPEIAQYKGPVVSSPRTYRLHVQPLSIARKLLDSLPNASPSEPSDVSRAPSQADDVQKIMRIPSLVLEGRTTGEEIRVQSASTLGKGTTTSVRLPPSGF